MIDVKTFQEYECEYERFHKVNDYEFFRATYTDEDCDCTDFYVVCKEGKDIEIYEDYEIDLFYKKFLELQDKMVFERTKHITLWTAIAHKALYYVVSGDTAERPNFYLLKTTLLRRLFGDKVSRHCYACEYAGCEIKDNTDLEDDVCDACPLIGIACDDEEDDASIYAKCVDAWRFGRLEKCAEYALKVAYAPVKEGVKYR